MALGNIQRHRCVIPRPPVLRSSLRRHRSIRHRWIGWPATFDRYRAATDEQEGRQEDQISHKKKGVRFCLTSSATAAGNARPAARQIIRTVRLPSEAAVRCSALVESHAISIPMTHTSVGGRRKCSDQLRVYHNAEARSDTHQPNLRQWAQPRAVSWNEALATQQNN